MAALCICEGRGEAMTVLIDIRTGQRPRHPEKLRFAETPSPPKPDWIRVRAPALGGNYAKTRDILRKYNLVTVCEEAGCPNISECWANKHATMMIMGDICTRACAFCNVRTGLPEALDPEEGKRVGGAVAALGLSHVVITSVDRDDLADGGAAHFASVVRETRAAAPQTTIEILTPDFLRKAGALAHLLRERIDVFNHNLETVPRLYPSVRPGARYYHSLRLLEQAKANDSRLFTKSGLMVGLGESREEILQVMDDLRCARVDFLTIGQYLRPSRRHAPIDRFVTPDEFDAYRKIAQAKGFLLAACGPMVRSSYHAEDDFRRLQINRLKLAEALADGAPIR